MPFPQHVLEAGPDDDGRRFDRVLFKTFPGMSRTVIFRLIRKGQARLGGKKASCSDLVHKGDKITIKYPIPSPNTSLEKHAANSAISKSDTGYGSVEILFQDDNIIALNKPVGRPAHGPGSLEQEVVNIWERTNSGSLSFRPGPVHRLDRNTSGIQVFSLSLAGARLFSNFFHEHALKKIYCGIVQGIMENPVVWEDFLLHDKDTRTSHAGTRDNGKPAKTRVIPLEHTRSAAPADGPGHTMVLFVPATGRTHQIRLQAQIHGHSLAGDNKYGGKPGKYGYLLHAIALSLPGREYPLPDIIAPLPESGRQMIAEIFGTQAMDLLADVIRELLDDSVNRHFP